MQSHTRAVVVGGGCVGAGILYGLARRGWNDCVLLEKSRLTGGSTWMAGGFIPSYVRSPPLSRLINKSIEIYSGLEAETGQAVGWDPCGQMRLARQSGRMDEYRSYMDTAEAMGANARLLTPQEVLELWPLLKDAEGLDGALYHPDDVRVSPTDVTMSLAKGARDKGAKVVEGVRALDFRRSPGGEWVVVTDQGEITCEHLILATGNYSREMGARLGLDIPAISLVVQFWITEAIPEIAERRRQGLPHIPIVRDEAFLGYTSIEGDGLMMGSYERPEHLELFGLDGVDPRYDGDLLPADFDAHAEAFERAAELIPVFKSVGIRSNTRGPMQMTADGLPLAGPAWGLDNVWLAEGVPGGILWGGALGHSLSEWIVEGEPSVDMSLLDPRRFGNYATREWTRAKAVEIWGTHSDVVFPGGESEAGRLARTPPAYDRLDALGAVWGVQNGWETPNWYAPEGGERVARITYRQASHGHLVEAEARAVREGAALIDMTPLAKFEVAGPGAEDLLDRVLATRLPSAGRIAQGLHLFGNGGVNGHYTVTRLADDLFYLVSAPQSERRNLDELRRLLPRDGSVTLRNVTGERGVFTVAGPRARDVLRQVSDMDLSGNAFPWLTAQTGSIGLAGDVRLLRMSALGELAWELHHPIASQRWLLDALLDAGADHGLRLVGQHALGGLRLEKSVPAIGPELHVEASALECGLGRYIAWDKPAFPGRDALLSQRKEGPSRALCTLRIDADHARVLGYESVYRDGALVGHVTSGGYSHVLGHALALAMLPVALAVPGTKLSVPLLGEMCDAAVLADAPYDPARERCRM